MYMPPPQHPDEHLMIDKAQRRIQGGRGRRRMSKLGMILVSGLVLAVIIAAAVLGFG